LQLQLLGQRRDVQNPRQVFRVEPPIDNHPCHSEPSGLNYGGFHILIGCGRLFEEIFDQVFESRIVPRSETALEDGTKRKSFSQEQCKIAFCAANVPGQNHYRPISLPHKSPDQRHVYAAE
jgi:hypothetical protein